jgi:hypothetical protein
MRFAPTHRHHGAPTARLAFVVQEVARAWKLVGKAHICLRRAGHPARRVRLEHIKCIRGRRHATSALRATSAAIPLQFLLYVLRASSALPGMCRAGHVQRGSTLKQDQPHAMCVQLATFAHNNPRRVQRVLLEPTAPKKLQTAQHARWDMFNHWQEGRLAQYVQQGTVAQVRPRKLRALQADTVWKSRCHAHCVLLANTRTHLDLQRAPFVLRDMHVSLHLTALFPATVVLIACWDP